MRLVYSSDLHGNAEMYEQLLSLAHERQAGAVIVGGDLLPRAIRLAEAIATQRAFVSGPLRALLTQFREAGGCPVYLLAGNDDWAAAIASLQELERAGLAHALHNQVYALEGGLKLAGYACVPVTPFSIKDYERRDTGALPPYSFEMAYVSAGAELPRRTSAAALAGLPTIAEELAALATQSDPARTVYVCHAPPHDTPLDQSRGRHLGSVAVREFAERRAPPLTLHGHIHEAPATSGRYAARIGATWSANPGNDGRRLHALLLDTGDIAGTLWHTVFGSLKIEG
jgi:Icc-related predicted phosphoesterase